MGVTGKVSVMPAGGVLTVTLTKVEIVWVGSPFIPLVKPKALRNPSVTSKLTVELVCKPVTEFTISVSSVITELMPGVIEVITGMEFACPTTMELLIAEMLAFNDVKPVLATATRTPERRKVKGAISAGTVITRLVPEIVSMNAGSPG
jgi:hypothetical protein